LRPTPVACDPVAMPKRYVVLPERGTLLVNTDIHGNLEDFERRSQLFEAALREDEEGAHWVILGDIVHGPDDLSRQKHPEFYGYPDESLKIVRGVARMQHAYPGRVHFVLGNHDHGHVGGPHTQKFHRDEVEWLETGAGAEDIATLRTLFQSGLLAVAAPCGLLLTHGAPNAAFESLDDLDTISLSGGNDARREELLSSLLTHYGQRDDVASKVLDNVSRGGINLRVIVHGHDRDERGFFMEGELQLCLCIFGTPRQEKRYLRVNLGARYGHVSNLRDGFEIRRLYD
jgi:predicted phosphodiesterase